MSIKIEKEDIEKIARGRIWTGKQAIEIGLIDKIGGYGTAVSLAKQIADSPDDAYFNIITYPKEKNFRDRIEEIILGSNVFTNTFISNSDVDIRYLKLFKRLQYDTVLPMFEIKLVTYPRPKNAITDTGRAIHVIVRSACRKVSLNSFLSPSPSSSVSFGKNAVEIATPIRFTGI